MAMPPARSSLSWQPPGLTLQGWVTALGGLVWGVIAWLTGQRDLILPGLFLIALPLASWLTLAFGSRSPAVQRQVTPSEVTAGGEITSRVVVDSTGLALGGAARYRDTHPDAVQGSAEASLPVGLGRHRIDHRLTVAWRGRHQLGPLRRSVTDALGLARTQRLLPGTADVLALPQIHPLEPLRAASGLGSASDATVLKTSLIGTDDVLVREYLPGDDVRRIHWRSTARTGALMVRREEQAWDPSAVVLLDNRAISLPRASLTGPIHGWSGCGGGGLHRDAPDRPRLHRGPASCPGHRSVRAATDRRADGAASPGRRGSLRPRQPRHAVATAPAEARGQLLLALLGRLDAADGSALAAAPRHQACWAMVSIRSRARPGPFDCWSRPAGGYCGWPRGRRWPPPGSHSVRSVAR
ncbi:MAG: DUF58 domain-containing protein [Propionibacteriaceae bacterium]|nr:DUF58 domain-containing protein [Propionibacteriaceae bacterium]